MPQQSSPFVKIRYFDKGGVYQALREFVAKLAVEHPEVIRVLLFGSLARDEAVPGSDVDLLVVLQHSDLPLIDRIPFFLPSSFPVGVDVFPYTEAEIKQGCDNFLLRRALTEGVEIFSRTGSQASA